MPKSGGFDDSGSRYNDECTSLPFSMARLSFTQEIITEAAVEKEHDFSPKETITEECSLVLESRQNTPRLLRQIPMNVDVDRDSNRSDNVLCDSLAISVPKHLDSPQISITTVNNSDDEIIVRRGLEREEGPLDIEVGRLLMQQSEQESSRRKEDGRYNSSSEEELVPRMDMGTFN